MNMLNIRLEQFLWCLFVLAVAALPFYGDYFVWYRGMTAPPLSKSLYGIISFSFVACVSLLFFRNRVFAIDCYLFVPVSLILLWSLVTLVWSFSVDYGLYDVSNWVCIVLVFLVAIQLLHNSLRLLVVAWVLHIAASIISAVVVVQHIVGNEFLLVGSTQHASVFGNKNMAMHYLILLVPLSFWLLLKPVSNYVFRVFAGLGLVFMLAYVVISQTRSAYLALAGELFLLGMAIFWFRSYLRQQYLTRDYSLFIGLLVMLCVVLNLPILFGVELPANMYGWTEKGSSGRLCIWESASTMLAQKPWFGWGAGNYEAVVQVYDSCGRAVHRAHNDFLQAFLELGIVGCGLILLLWLVVFGRLCGRALHAWRSDFNSLPFFVLLAFLGTSAQAVVTFPYQLPYMGLFLAVVLAVGLSPQKQFAYFSKCGFGSPRYWLSSLGVMVGILSLLCVIAINIQWLKEFRFYQQTLLGEVRTETDYRSINPKFNNPLVAKSLQQILTSYLSEEDSGGHIEIPQRVRLLMLENALHKNGYNIRILRELAEYYRVQGNPVHALAYYNGVANISANTGAYTRFLLEYFPLLEKQKGRDQSKAVFLSYYAALKGVWSESNRVHWHIPDQQALVNLALRYQEPKILIESMNRIIEKQSSQIKNSPKVSYLLGLSYAKLGNAHDAQLWLNQYLAYFPRDKNARKAREILSQLQRK